MLSPSDVILLLEKWTRRTFAVDIRKTDIGDDFMTQYTTTDKVRHITEMGVNRCMLGFYDCTSADAANECS